MIITRNHETVTRNEIAIVRSKLTITRKYEKTRRNKFTIIRNSWKCQKVTVMRYKVAFVRYNLIK